MRTNGSLENLRSAPPRTSESGGKRGPWSEDFGDPIEVGKLPGKPTNMELCNGTLYTVPGTYLEATWNSIPSLELLGKQPITLYHPWNLFGSNTIPSLELLCKQPGTLCHPWNLFGSSMELYTTPGTSLEVTWNYTIPGTSLEVTLYHPWNLFGSNMELYAIPGTYLEVTWNSIYSPWNLFGSNMELYTNPGTYLEVAWNSIPSLELVCK